MSLARQCTSLRLSCSCTYSAWYTIINLVEPPCLPLTFTPAVHMQNRKPQDTDSVQVTGSTNNTAAQLLGTTFVKDLD